MSGAEVAAMAVVLIEEEERRARDLEEETGEEVYRFGSLAGLDDIGDWGYRLLVAWIVLCTLVPVYAVFGMGFLGWWPAP